MGSDNSAPTGKKSLPAPEPLRETLPRLALQRQGDNPERERETARRGGNQTMKPSAYRPGKRQTRFVLSRPDMRHFGARSPRAVNRFHLNRPLRLLPPLSVN